jgi:uncharacterized protein YndB with AHSA1/START domain
VFDVAMDKIVYESVKLKCSARKAFDLFTKDQHLQKWLAKIAEVEPRVGGKYELFWNARDRENDSTIGCNVLAIKPASFLCFEWKGPMQFKHFMNETRPLTNVVVFFIQKGDETEVHLLHTGWRESKEWEQARLWFERAWKNAFRTLKRYAET